MVSKPVFSIYLDFKVHFLKVSKIGAPNGHIWNKIMVVLNYNPKYKINIRESDAKNLALCAPMPEGSTETEFWRNKENPFNLCLAKGKHSRLVSQELCPFLWRTGRDFTSHRRSSFFFLLQGFKLVTAGIRKRSLLFLKLSASALLFEMQNATGECRQGRLPGTENSSDESSQSALFSPVKKSSHKCVC